MSTTSVVNQWSRDKVIISTTDNEHLAFDSTKRDLTVVRGIGDRDIVNFTFGSRNTFLNDQPSFICYISHTHDDVTFYVRSCGGHVALQAFAKEPHEEREDGRVFELRMNKKWCQFRSLESKDLFLYHDDKGFCLKKQNEADKTSNFDFEIIQITDR